MTDKMLDYLTMRISVAENKVDTLTKLLKSIEWLQSYEYDAKYCPVCKAEDRFGGKNHYKDCKLDKVLNS